MKRQAKAVFAAFSIGLCILAVLIGCRPGPSSVNRREPRASGQFLEVDPFYEDPEWVAVLGPAIGRTRPLATVNGEEIRREDLDARLIQLIIRRKTEGLPVDRETIEDLRANLLSVLVDLTLLKQEALRTRLDIDPKAVKEIYEDRRKAYDSDREFREALARHGETEQTFRQICENEIRVRMLRRRIEDRKLREPTEQEVLGHYTEVERSFTKVRASQLVISATAGMPAIERDRRRELAYSLRSRILGGEPFEKLALEYSDDEETRTRGGQIEDQATLSTLQPHIADALADRTVGYVTEPVETDWGFVLFKILDVKRLDLDKLRSGIIRYLKDEQRAENVTQWLMVRRQTADIQIFDEAIRQNLASRSL